MVNPEKVVDVAERIVLLIDGQRIVGKQPAQISRIGGCAVYAKARLAFGTEVNLTVDFCLKGKTVQKRVEIGMGSATASPSKLGAKVVLIQQMFELGCLLESYIEEIEIDPDSFEGCK